MPSKQELQRKRRSTTTSPKKKKEAAAPPPPLPGKPYVSPAMLSTPELERTISRILLLRFQWDIARLFSRRLHHIAQEYIPKLMRNCLVIASPGWLVANAASDEVKDFYRSCIAFELRQAGERVSTKSVLWSYTALRHFAVSHNVSICEKSGVHAARLIPHHNGLKRHLDVLERIPIMFSKPPHLPPAKHGLDEFCKLREKTGPCWADWRKKMPIAHSRFVNTLWQVANEFDVAGYGRTLRDKLTDKWCDCGCSTDHLGEVCEKTVRQEEEEAGKRPGKEREWDGRGLGVFGWETEQEEDVWQGKCEYGDENLEERYISAERDKNRGNACFKAEDWAGAIEHYRNAYNAEPEMPHYQLNIAAAELKRGNPEAAEKACTIALGQHRSVKGYWRRAKARRMMGKNAEAISDLQALLKIQPSNLEALEELESLVPRNPMESLGCSSSSSSPSRFKRGTDTQFELQDLDLRVLKISTLPLTLPQYDGSGLETFTWPSWDRYKVERVM